MIFAAITLLIFAGTFFRVEILGDGFLGDGFFGLVFFEIYFLGEFLNDEFFYAESVPV